ncbi:alpha/beta fold hydrolase [Nonomuraea dietziae]|uniref:alpha/beta fold hydrolase n=1 Tax=Nonomuraea dietziae TaxID=65515 RepID=UPI0033CFD884
MPIEQRMIKVNGVELSMESFGRPVDPAILLVHGAGHSLLAWEEGFVQRLVAEGRYVIRFDSRDAGLSTMLHGTEDPLFPIEHGRALAKEIPGARFVAMAQTGHEVFPRAQWDTVVPAILEHTKAR